MSVDVKGKKKKGVWGVTSQELEGSLLSPELKEKAGTEMAGLMSSLLILAPDTSCSCSEAAPRRTPVAGDELPNSSQVWIPVPSRSSGLAQCPEVFHCPSGCEGPSVNSSLTPLGPEPLSHRRAQATGG